MAAKTLIEQYAGKPKQALDLSSEDATLEARAFPSGLVAGVVLRIPRKQLLDGLFTHLGFTLTGNQLLVPDKVRPHPDAGR